MTTTTNTAMNESIPTTTYRAIGCTDPRVRQYETGVLATGYPVTKSAYTYCPSCVTYSMCRYPPTRVVNSADAPIPLTRVSCFPAAFENATMRAMSAI